MNIFITISLLALLSLDVVDARGTLYGINNNDNEEEPTPDEFFGLLGIFPSFCDSKIGRKFVKCQTDPPISRPTSSMMMGGKGKGGNRHQQRRMVSVTVPVVRDDRVHEDIVDAFNALSPEDKKRLLVAVQQDDVTVVDAIFDHQSSSSTGSDNTYQRTLEWKDDEPSPDEFFGKLGIFPSFCDTKIGRKFVKCLTDPPVPAPTRSNPRPSPSGGGKGKGMMGKRHERRTASSSRVIIANDNVDAEFVTMVNAMPSNDQHRLLMAIQQEDGGVVNELLARYNLLLLL